MNYVCILDSTTKKVVNVIVLDDGAEWSPPEGQEFAPQHDGGIGDTWDGEKFIPKPQAPPSSDSSPLDNSGSGPNVIG